MRKSIVAATFLLLTLAGCGAGEAGAEEPTDSTQTGSAASENKGEDKGKSNTTQVGKALDVKLQSGAKAQVTVLKVTTAKKGKGEFAEKPQNGQFLIVDVQIKVTDKEFSVNPLYFKYQAANEKVYDSGDGNAFASGHEPQLESGEVPTGQTSRGLVVFDTPAGAGKQIQLTDELGSPIAFWTL
ncbi:DUF4352 domain-containing protein [Micromonospora sp. CPCC 205371]|nr:DUF4352 domain-containing protein [Micromonospora sp. CPCC 205371]